MAPSEAIEIGFQLPEIRVMKGLRPRWSAGVGAVPQGVV
jgi:hypothetical protein